PPDLGLESSPSPSPAPVGAHPPPLALKRSVASSFSVPLIFSLLVSFKKFPERECRQPAARSRANCYQNEIGETSRTHALLRPLLGRLLQIIGQAIERSLPELSILLDPLRGFFQRLC